MRSKAPLTLMEQLIMVLVFALAAALCLRAFVGADGLSREKELRNRALTEGQSMAEVTKACSGDLALAAGELGGWQEEGRWVRLFDENWALVRDETQARCRVEVVLQTGETGLGRAQVRGFEIGEEELLFTFPVAWQEEVTGLG